MRNICNSQNEYDAVQSNEDDVEDDVDKNDDDDNEYDVDQNDDGN